MSEAADHGSNRPRIFRAAAEMSRQEAFHPTIEVEAILLVVEAVTFVSFYDVLDIEAPLPEGLHDLVGFGLLDPRVVGSLGHQQGGFDPVGVKVRNTAVR
jgi:hypothetical protein